MRGDGPSKAVRSVLGCSARRPGGMATVMAHPPGLAARMDSRKALRLPLRGGPFRSAGLPEGREPALCTGAPVEVFRFQRSLLFGPHLRLGARQLLEQAGRTGGPCRRSYRRGRLGYVAGDASGLKIRPWLVLPFITTTRGESKHRWRTQPSSSTAGFEASQSQATNPSPTSGLTVK